jgi:hypothetical protein
VLTCCVLYITTGIQQQEQDAEPAEARSSSTAAAAAAAPDSSSRAKQLQQSHEKQKEGKGLSGSFVRALAGLSVGSLSNAVMSVISSMLNTQVITMFGRCCLHMLVGG